MRFSPSSHNSNQAKKNAASTRAQAATASVIEAASPPNRKSRRRLRISISIPESAMLPQSLFQTALSMSPRYNDVLAHAAKLIKDKASTQKTSIQRPASHAYTACRREHFPSSTWFPHEDGFEQRYYQRCSWYSELRGMERVTMIESWSS